IKFGGNVVDRVTLLNVNCVLRSRSGKSTKGFGSMPMGNIWAFPAKTMSYDETLAAMKELAGRINKITGAHKEYGHPVDLNVALEPQYLKAADAMTRDLKLKEALPKLFTLVAASPFDAAIHDAYGKSVRLSVWKTYGPEHMTYDLSHYLGSGYKDEYLSQYVTAEPKARMPLYHLVGALDPLVDGD